MRAQAAIAFPTAEASSFTAETKGIKEKFPAAGFAMGIVCHGLGGAVWPEGLSRCCGQHFVMEWVLPLKLTIAVE